MRFLTGILIRILIIIPSVAIPFINFVLWKHMQVDKALDTMFTWYRMTTQIVHTSFPCPVLFFSCCVCCLLWWSHGISSPGNKVQASAAACVWFHSTSDCVEPGISCCAISYSIKCRYYSLANCRLPGIEGDNMQRT